MKKKESNKKSLSDIAKDIHEKNKNNVYLILNVNFKIAHDKQYLNFVVIDRNEDKLIARLVEIPKNNKKKNYIDAYFMVDNILQICDDINCEFVCLLNNQNFYSYLIKMRGNVDENN